MIRRLSTEGGGTLFFRTPFIRFSQFHRAFKRRDALVSRLSPASDEIESDVLSRSSRLNGISHPASFLPAAFIEIPATIRILENERKRKRKNEWERKRENRVRLRRRVNFTRHYPDADFFVLSEPGEARRESRCWKTLFSRTADLCRSTAGNLARNARADTAMRRDITRATDGILVFILARIIVWFEKTIRMYIVSARNI